MICLLKKYSLLRRVEALFRKEKNIKIGGAEGIRDQGWFRICAGNMVSNFWRHIRDEQNSYNTLTGSK
jgi:hypothetical protein